MSLSMIMNALYLAFAVIGAADFLLDNKLGMGAAFERGICCAGKLIIAMVGFMSLASFLGRILGPVATPLFTAVGADPSALAGLFLASDSGGVALATQMASDMQAAKFNGYFVGSTLGCSIMSTIPLVMLSIDERTRTAGIYGLLFGLAAMPVGCAVSGIVAGMPVSVWLPNLIPCTAFSLILIIALLFFYKYIIRPFQFFGKFLLAVSMCGLLLAAAKQMLGVEIIGMQPFSEIMETIGGIVLVLSGVFPLMELVARLLRKPLSKAAEKLHIQNNDVFNLFVSTVNPLPVIDSLKDMTAKGVMFNCAFMVSVGCAIGDFFAYTSQTAPELVGALIAGKFAGGLISLAAAIAFAPTLLPENPECATH